MGWKITPYIDKEENEDKARVEFEVCEVDEYGDEYHVKSFVHIVDAK